MSEIKRYTVTEPYLKCSTKIGENIHYDPSTNTLNFLDILKNDFHSIDLRIGPSSHKVIKDILVRPHKTVDLLHNDDMWLCAGKLGFGLMNKKTGKSKYIAYFSNEKAKAEGLMSNDGAVDSRGRFWVGTMADPIDVVRADGSLWRIDPDLTVHEIIAGRQGVPNGTSWSANDKIMYYTDSTRGSIFAYDFDVETGSISNERVFFKPTEGAPDGHAVDEEGFLWVALYGTSKVVKISPEAKIVAEVVLPVKNITDVAFVGDDIFISCATNQDSESPELEGALFKCHVGVKGAKLNKFGLSKDYLASEEAKL